MFLRLHRLAALHAAFLLSACEPESEPESSPREPSAAETALGGDALVPGGAPIPVLLRCSFSYRESNVAELGDLEDDPKFIFEEKELRAVKDETSEATLGQITLRITQRGKGRGSSIGSFHISALTDGKQLVSWLYQFDPAAPPIDQFAGGHGFTGSVHMTHPTAGGDYQLFCSAVRT